MPIKLRRTNRDTGAVYESEYKNLREAQVYTSYQLYDNGAADKKTAQALAPNLKLGYPVSHGPYTFEVEKI